MLLRFSLLLLFPLVFLTAQEGPPTLPPGTMLLPESVLPEYERNIDHTRLIEDVNKNVLKMGRSVYQQVCHNCHGDVNLPGSIPNSLKFAEGQFQHGNDPYKMYQTLTRGWRLMIPQVQLSPREKYAVIHYIRDHFLAKHNKDQYFNVTDHYLANLPKGESLGPDPVKREPWRDMDYGPFLIGTFEINDAGKKKSKPLKKSPPDFVSVEDNIGYKSIAVRLDQGPGGISQGRTWLAFEHDTMRVSGAWTGQGFIDWHGINFDGRHVVRPRTVGSVIYETDDGPGWANPDTGEFEDFRFEGLDGLRYGPLPREWAHFEGLYKHGNRVIVAYTIGKTKILETHDSDESGNIKRILNVGKSPHDLLLRVANTGPEVGVLGTDAVNIRDSGGYITATIPAAATPLHFAFLIGKALEPTGKAKVLDPAEYIKGGPTQWPQPAEAMIIRGEQDGPFQWDSFAMPPNNWRSRLRASGVDFTPDGKSAIVCCWDGDVWRVEGIADENATTTKWYRIASGLFQPLGVKLIGEDIFVSCRNQIVRLVDLNGDGETDFHENFNSDHQVTEHFHEFAMGLQTDDDGNFYYAKSGRHARPPLVAQHGTLLKVSADGARTEILANGFRAANGVCRNPDGTFFVTDQEGHWNPMNRINWVKPDMGFHGNMWSYGAPEDSSDTAMEQPLCWVDKQFDRSPAELLWIDSKKWGRLDGKLLHISYGHGRLEIVPHETVNSQLQGGLCRLPIPDFPTGTMRGRFHPDNGHLYLCGMSAWGTAQMQLPGGFYRIRATGKPMHLPVELKAHSRGVDVTFSDPLSPKSAEFIDTRFKVRSWALKRTKNYGSKHHGERTHKVTGARLSKNNLTLSLDIDGMTPVWQMSIKYLLEGANDEKISGEIQNTIHNLGD